MKRFLMVLSILSLMICGCHKSVNPVKEDVNVNYESGEDKKMMLVYPTLNAPLA